MAMVTRVSDADGGLEGPETMRTGDTRRSTSRSVIEAVADETGTDPLELEPLYRTVDPDSLDALFRDRPSGRGSGLLRVEFTFGGCRVVVSSDDTIAVSSGDEDVVASSPSSLSGGSAARDEPPD